MTDKPTATSIIAEAYQRYEMSFRHQQPEPPIILEYATASKDVTEFLAAAPREVSEFEKQLNQQAFEASKRIVNECIEAIPKRIRAACDKGILEYQFDLPECARVNSSVLIYLITEINKLGLPCIITNRNVNVGPRGQMAPTIH